MPEEWIPPALTVQQIAGARTDEAIATLAGRQHGVVARRQLHAMGVDDHAIGNRVARGLLLRLHRGVFAVGHRHLRPEGRWLAAVLAAGPGAALSHRSAAALHGLRQSEGAADVSTTGRRRISGIVVYARRLLDREDVTTCRGIPVTAIPRTLVDLGELVEPRELSRVLGEADRHGKLDVLAIERALRRTRGRHGAGPANVRQALDELAAHGAAFTRSSLEDAFLALIDGAGLPRPATNATIDGYEVDAVWCRHQLAVELDGYAFHRDRRAFQRDRTKGNRLIAAGYTVLRFTYADVVRRPARTAAEVAAFLVRDQERQRVERAAEVVAAPAIAPR